MLLLLKKYQAKATPAKNTATRNQDTSVDLDAAFSSSAANVLARDVYKSSLDSITKMMGYAAYTCSGAPMVAMHFSSIAMGVGSLFTSTVVRQG